MKTIICFHQLQPLQTFMFCYRLKFICTQIKLDF